MFCDNKYTRWYFSIVDRAKIIPNLGMTEKHHIIPRSLGGDNSKRNIVRLTPKQHFICHLLLTRMTYGLAKQKMVLAIHLMQYPTINQTRTRKLTSSSFNRLRQERSEIMKSKTMSIETREKISKGLSGRKLSPEHIEAARQARVGKTVSKETKQKISNTLKGDFSHWTESRKQKISAALSGKKRKMPLTDEQRKSRSEAMKLVWAKRRIE